MDLSFVTGVLVGAILAGTAVMYAALGETISERGGVVNLGVEGAMLIGASVSALVAWYTASPWLGLLAGAVAAGVFNLGLAVLAVTRRANQLASGLTMGFLGIGVSALIGKSVVGQMINGFESWPVPVLSSLPVLGPVLFDHDILVYLVVPIAVVTWWVLFRTRWGLHLRAVGEDLTVAYAAGLKPAWLQYQAVFLGGLLAGMGGVQLALSYAGVWNEGITAGRGFIAVALVIFAGWNPLRVVLGALLFGGALAFQFQLQARGAPISPFFLDMIPYLLTLGALLFSRKGRRSTMPAGLKSVLESSQ